MVVKMPPAKILPSACTAIELTVLFAFGLKASSVPSGFNRAMWLRVTAAPPLGESVVKSPPIRILPSDWTTTTRTTPLAFGSKPSSADCPHTAAAPPASAKPTMAIKLNRADERNLFPAKFFIFGFSFGRYPRGYLDERCGVNLFAGSIGECVMVAGACSSRQGLTGTPLRHSRDHDWR